jgi:hypothetical protein
MQPHAVDSSPKKRGGRSLQLLFLAYEWLQPWFGAAGHAGGSVLYEPCRGEVEARLLTVCICWLWEYLH